MPELKQSFEVAAPIEQVWEALIDIERIAPCLPGASVTGRNEDGSYAGAMTIKIGPTTAAYAGKLEMENVDSSSHRATMQAQGTDKRGQGGAKATINSSLSPADSGGTHVEVVTDYHITGRLARFGRGGMIEDISERLLGQFAQCLQSKLVGGQAEQAEEAASEGGATNGDQPPSAAAEASQADTATAATGPTASEHEAQPLDAVPLVAGLVKDRAVQHRAPIGALMFGFLLALLILRRRRRART
jgi:uncharacterized protein